MSWQAAVYGGTAGGNSAQRRPPPAKIRRAILLAQRGCCYYCEKAFGAIVLRRGRPIRLRLHWDHYVPFAYLNTNPEENWRAACHVCNSAKGSSVFMDLSLDEVRRRVLSERTRRGYAP